MTFFCAELRRLLRRPRLWFTLGCVIIIWGSVLFRARHGIAGARAWWTVYTLNLESYRLFLPLLVSIVAGTSLVDDRATGFVRYVLYRGISRTWYFFAKIGAGIMVAAFSSGIPMLTLGVLMIQIGNPTSDNPAALPLPHLFPQSVSAVLLWYTMTTMFGGIFFFVIGTFVALFSKNRYLVIATPFIFHLLTIIVFPFTVVRFSPQGLLSLENERLSPIFVIVYWLSIISVGCLVSLTIVRHRERID